MLDDLAALRLQLEWGIDEALADAPLDRLLADAPLGRLLAARTAPGPHALRAPITPKAAPESVPRQDVAGLPTLAAVHAALDAFRDHPLRATASATVPPAGDPTSGLVILGDAPGADDDRSGQAFSGKAGAALDRVFGSAGLGREHALLTFLVPWRPPGGRAPNEAEMALVLPYLYRMLMLSRPRHLVLLGEVALRTLVDAGTTLRACRGQWTEVNVPGMDPPVPALPMLAPDRWLQSPTTRQQTWTDLLTLQEARAQA